MTIPTNRIAEVLEPFAREAEKWPAHILGVHAITLINSIGDAPLRVGHLRAARQLLTELRDGQGAQARDDWRCVHCKHVVNAAIEPERCPMCNCRTFAHCAPSVKARHEDERARAIGFDSLEDLIVHCEKAAGRNSPLTEEED